jgi:hypothetical protein
MERKIEMPVQYSRMPTSAGAPEGFVFRPGDRSPFFYLSGLSLPLLG